MREAEKVYNYQKLIKNFPLKGRGGGGIGAGGTGGGAWGCAASCAHRAQGGLCVRPANGWGSSERLRLGLMGSASAGPDDVQHHT
jgi:hypothetical protein